VLHARVIQYLRPSHAMTNCHQIGGSGTHTWTACAGLTTLQQCLLQRSLRSFCWRTVHACQFQSHQWHPVQG
jgi:hypothetical protein